ncbi:MAG: SGNH/GDSL hydrolase family protein [Micromonosporaceae bacterium]|jgi:lysophospholipase L1-like esterase|nr:SGNH/GDSL hydrolase family protein [Micromonosporaceae bacterium]
MSRRCLVVVVLLLSVSTAACKETAGTRPGAAGAPRSGLPSSMAALGDSLTSGFGSCLTLAACTRNSWSTGGGTQVNSHYLRIRARNPAISRNNHNFAVPGARAAGLAGQAAAAVREKVDYVTVLIGANDACRRKVAEMTPVATFRRQVDAGLATIKKGLPRARVLVVSIPDLYRLWQVGHTNRNAVRAWSLGVCPSLLAHPASTAEMDAERRRAVRARIDDYNRALAAACRAYGPLCRYDGGAAHRVRFDLSMVNHLDYFHPSVAGQNKLASVTFPRRFW